MKKEEVGEGGGGGASGEGGGPHTCVKSVLRLKQQCDLIVTEVVSIESSKHSSIHTYSVYSVDCMYGVHNLIGL